MNIEYTKGDITAIKKVAKSGKFITKFEYAKLIGIRAMQLAKGSPPKIKVEKGAVYDNIEIAKQEIEARTLPFLIVREINGKTEEIHLKDMILCDD